MSYFFSSSELPLWIGKPPAGWRSDWLKWHVGLSTARPSEEEAEQLPYIANEDIAAWTGKLLRDEPQPAEADSRKFQTDDVLFNKLRPYLAKVFHAPFNGTSSGELLCLRPASHVLPRFLFYVASSKAFVDAVNAETFGSKMPRADWEIVGHQPLPLPPLDVQRRIVALLDEKTAQIDGLIACKQALLELLAEKRQAIITQAVTNGLNPAAPRKDSGIDWLGKIPAHWEVKRLRFLVKLLSGATPTTGMSEYWDGNISWISPKDMKMDEITDSIDKVTIFAVEDYGLKRFDSPNVVIVVRGMILARYVPVSVASGTYTINQDMKVMRSKGAIAPWYLQMYLTAIRSYMMTLIGEAGHGTKALRTDVLMDTPILLPPAQEQQAIIALIKDRKERLDSVAAKVTQFIASLTEYRAALITSAVTGQIEGLR